MNAAVVTEHEWEAPPRPMLPVPSGLVRSRVGHATSDCPRITPTEITDRDVPMDSPAAGIPCSYCVPIVEGVHGPPREAAPVPRPETPAASPARGPRTAPRGGPSTRPTIPDDLVVTARPNRYAGKCEACGNMVRAEAGRLALRGTSYVVVHKDGECRSVPPGGRSGRRTTKRGKR